MALALCQHEAATQRQQSDGCDLVSSLQRCSDQLRGLCGDFSDAEEAEDDDDDALSAADIASECMSLLESIHFSDCEEGNPIESDVLRTVEAESPKETELMKEINALGDELQALMRSLCDGEEDGEVDDTPTSAGIVVSHESPSYISEICQSPHMKELTSRLSNRPTTYLMARHTARNRHSFSTQLKHLSDKLKAQTHVESPTRELLNNAAFWRQHQSKSFRQHIARQSQARKQEELEKEKLNKAVEYRYRRVSKPCYPLAQKSTVLQVASPTTSIILPGVDSSSRKTPHSYAARFGTSIELPKSEAAEDRGLLCGVYLYGKRRTGTLYLTCSSMEQLKTRAKQRFQLLEDLAVLSLYREQVSKGGRMYLHRIASFDELRNGDLLCATTDSYQDMAIVCAWMKQRQRRTHSATSKEKITPTQGSKPAPVSQVTTSLKKMNEAPSDSLAFQPPEPPAIKLWDQNGRLMNISQRLPL